MKIGKCLHCGGQVWTWTSESWPVCVGCGQKAKTKPCVESQADRELVDAQLVACTRTMREVAEELKAAIEHEMSTAGAFSCLATVRVCAEKLLRVRAEKVVVPISKPDAT